MKPKTPKTFPRVNFKTPKATLALLAAIILVYFWYSQGTFFLPSGFLNSMSLAPESIATVFTYLFLHIGIIHLTGNAVSLLAFGSITEQVLSPKDVLGVFLVSGVSAGLLFALINPGTLLAGASAGIAGLMTASVLLKPKHALVALI
ncbi:MAG: rhomboid family intramembrane serine protease, partial [Candidatus Micrarchaeota archaeon]